MNSRKAVYLTLVAFVLALALALALDRWAYTHVYDPSIYDRDWGRMLRVMGFLPLWLAAAAALWLHDGRARAARALFLAAGPTVSGIVGEPLKLLIRRERPWAHEGAWVLRPWSDHPLSSGGLATPSSHALVAFGAAFVLARLFPRAAPVWVLLAVGCAYTRVAAHAHFLSDVVLGAFVAWAVVALLWRRWRRALAGGPRPERA